MDMRLEVVVVPVSDVDRAKRFYEKLGFRLDIDLVVGESFRVVQFTPQHMTRTLGSAGYRLTGPSA